ncbi:MAG: leucine-rich repeat domain-containing protein [Lachnospiraceae bacterium]|nr:leucine-rich repeat domain-containing protein [Lachnospiraceae bacterium]
MKTKLKKGIAIGLSLALTAGFAPQINTVTDYAAAEADAQETVSCVNVGTEGLKSVPQTVLHPEDDASTGGWYLTYSQKLYFGHYDGVDTAYRVLKNDGSRILLDCDNILYMMTWSEDGLANPEQQSGDVLEWMGSDIQKDLSAKYRNGVFCDEKEKTAVLYSSIPQREEYQLDSLPRNASARQKYFDYAVNDYYFVLSASEWAAYYGQIQAYCNRYDMGTIKRPVDNTLTFANYWLRSKMTQYGYKSPFQTCTENNIGVEVTETDEEGAVSPAFYLDSSKVLLTTLSDKEKASKLEAVTTVKMPPAIVQKYGVDPVLQGENLNWKLTLKDSTQSIQAGTPARLGNTITLPYIYSGDCANRVSVMITDKAYTDTGAQVLYYGKVSEGSGVAASGTVTFDVPWTLPEGCHAYLFAEQVNGPTATDYATEPVEFLIPEGGIISNVVITGLDAPKGGDALDTEAVCATAGLTPQTPAITWTPSGRYADFNTEYEASVTLAVKQGWLLQSGAYVVINSWVGELVQNQDGTITVSITYDKTGNVSKNKQIVDEKSKSFYQVTKTGTDSTVQYVKPEDSVSGEVTIPAKITVGGKSYKVTVIMANAFKNNKKITGVTIGSNIKTIGNSAFYGCKKLKNVKIGSAVTTIGEKAFYACSALKTVTMGKKVTTIKTKAFYKCTALAKITLPSKVKKIGKQAFYGCKKLKTITVKTTKLTTKNVGSQAFKGIHAKPTVKVPKKKYAAYKKLLKAKGVGKRAVYKKQ